ncbi:MAG: glycosyltransferase family 1 protein [Thermoanaerobaculia bacterium]
MSQEQNIRARGVGVPPPASASYASSPRLRLQESESFPIVVHSHLRWSFVWQRPQQTHSRLARSHRVLFIEEPVGLEAGENPHLKIREVAPNLLVAQPAIPDEPGETFESRETRVLSVLREALAGPLGRRFARAAHWVYTPLMEPQIALFREPAAILYDCMDELANFAFAPPQLERRETRLISRADLVFTGGHELYLAKRSLHSHVHPFGCGVDFEHFHRVAAGLPEAADLAKIPAPRLGYVGVIDERLDYDLIGRLAAENPESSVVLVGPIVKVDPEALPKAANLHYLGARDYLALPYYLAGFDVCLMPFALNDASRYINPTKTLEYLASGKPVLSTPVKDVVRQFADVVTVAPAAVFPAAARAILSGTRLDRRKGLETARKSSWEATVRRMEQLLEQAIARREKRWVPSSLREASA